jgi:hypothetical protein
MNLVGPILIAMNGACSASVGTIVPIGAIKKAVTMRSWAHLILWVSLEQSVQE